MKVRVRTVCVFLLTGGLLFAFAGAVIVYGGLYNVSALAQHTRAVFMLADRARVHSVAQRANDIDVPDLSDPALAKAGFGLYHEHCELCHGAPGVAPAEFSLGMQPLPTAIVGIARKRQEKPAEMYWVIENGVKMTGMPAWKYRLSTTQIWQLVAFLEEIPYLTSAMYRQRVLALESSGLATQDGQTLQFPDTAPPVSDVQRGREAIQQYGCSACHRIPGITAAVNDVGPPLDRMGDRKFIAGVLANTTQNMVRWLRSPLSVSPETTMPDLNVKEADAVAMAAYLGTLHAD